MPTCRHWLARAQEALREYLGFLLALSVAARNSRSRSPRRGWIYSYLIGMFLTCEDCAKHFCWR